MIIASKTPTCPIGHADVFRANPLSRKHCAFSSQRITADLLISYWLLAWFAFYMILSYYNKNSWIREYFNPIVALIIASVINLFFCIIILAHSSNYSGVFVYTFLNVIIKFVPISILLYYGEPIHIWINLAWAIVVFILYCAYLYLRGTDIFKIYKATVDSIITGDNKTPILHLLHRWFPNYI